MQTPVLEIVNLCKRFGERTAVDDVSLRVPAGSFFGLVGPNGAGKTTTLSMAVGLLRPDSGTVRVEGLDVWADAVAARSRLGVLPDGLALPERLTGRELLTYLGRLRGLAPRVAAGRADELLAILDLAGADRTLVIDYSTGMRKKIGLAAALLHGPSLLVLDEPFEAVDPVSALTIRAMLRQFIAIGGTVVLSSHVMATVEQLCDHVAIVHRGRIAAAGPLDRVRAGATLEERLVELVGADLDLTRSPSWLVS
ncbi:ABC transporter ATP-binding protein [Catellatospora sp. NPDC049133]|uniref:ABC transporter ATP-binding protein n=1 Tax=Catellatospora sp. NPDC049133 TaxID=3155499 RepID=UPI0033E96D8E